MSRLCQAPSADFGKLSSFDQNRIQPRELQVSLAVFSEIGRDVLIF